MDKKSIQKMSDVRLAALEGLLDDKFSYYASDEEKESLEDLYRTVNDICLSRSLNSEYYIERHFEEYQEAYNEFNQMI